MKTFTGIGQVGGTSMNAEILDDHVADMQIAKNSPVTIKHRLEVLHRLAAHLDRPLLLATPAELREHQQRFAHLQPATVNIYSRHIKAFYDWARKRRLIDDNPADQMVIPRVPKGRPHPTLPAELRVIFACTTGDLRMAYVLAAFAGLRRGEICQLHRRHLDLTPGAATALVHGKGGKERRAPLLAPVVRELYEHPLSRSGWVITRDGQQYPPEKLSIDSHYHLQRLGLETTLHSMRGAFATSAGRTTKDPMFVRDLLGHESVRTTEIYIQTNMNDAHLRLAGVADLAEDYLGERRPAVRLA